MKNALSVDVEEWFCGHILQKGLDEKGWEAQGLRALKVTRKLLRILERHKTKATFFMLGWLVERIPELIIEIEEAGHEIGIHGYAHVSITEMTPEEFEEDLVKALNITKTFAKSKIYGFRAPHFTITKKTLWALETLTKHGLKYDSSVFPLSFHPDYGIDDSNLSIYKITPRMIEVPLSVIDILGKRVPCSGGGYFRVYPYGLTKYLLTRCNREGRPIVFYLHPWELDPDQPRIHIPFYNKIRHYYNLDKVEYRLNRLLEDFSFSTIKEVIGL
ncbi:DUF3473 domain-containing protein [candidate division WOR-3 bacterium]|uniref:DUF3473 domain-containing protein n=1 Tax=candidate division WOR-3 bacterium TaxID=2052148 RepID=A0A9D5K933_UNCW3|nr:DUF3473 domain-containing protein [candidate division WOR-3 bacterium]MBD3364621.1 DUF3473 domain-containing protein [candidate division WOR-3 bacterium]